MRKILHIDADAFFAAVEQRDFPELRGKPIAVGSDTPRGVVATASYEARRYGVGSAMPSRMARKLCPNLIFVRPRFDAYRQVSRQMRDIFSRYTELVEPVSIDEAYLDVTDPLTGPPSATLIARDIRKAIRQETGLTVTAGVSYCKFLAKLASGMRKPDALNVILQHEAAGILASLPVERIHGVGPRTAQRMRELGIRTGTDLRARTQQQLTEAFGKMGLRYWQLIWGIDDRPVDPVSIRKSVSTEETFALDLETVQQLELEVPALAEGVARRLAKTGAMARGVSVKVKYADHSIQTRQQLLPLPISSASQIAIVARQVLNDRFVQLEQPVRLLGVGTYELQEAPLQPPLFPDWQPLEHLALRDR